MSREAEILAARKRLLATRASLQRVKAAHELRQLQESLPFDGQPGRLRRVLQYAGIAVTLLKFIRSVLGVRRRR